jgi:hypothetical protein
MKKLMCLIAVLVVFCGIAMAEPTIRPDVDIRVTGDSLGFAGGVSSNLFTNNVAYADMKYVVMASNDVDNKLQLGVGLNVIEALYATNKTSYDSKNVFLRAGIAVDLLDNLNLEYVASLAFRF